MFLFKRNLKVKECVAYMANFNISFNRRTQTELSLNRNAEKRHRGAP